MEYLFGIFAIVWMICQIQYPGPSPLYKLIALLVGIILILFVMFGMPAYHLRG